MIVEELIYKLGLNPEGVYEQLANIQGAAKQVDSEFNSMASRWGGVVKGLISNVIAPVAGAFAVGKIVNSYMSDVSEVARLTGAYNQKLDEWRVKRAQLARVTKEDIVMYKQYKEAMTGFNIAVADVSAKLMRSFAPVLKIAISYLQDFTKWINRNQDNIVRFLLVISGVLTGVFLPSLLKVGAALLASPLTWLIGALGVLVVLFDDLTTYIRGGRSALSGFWSIFGTGPEIMQKLNAAFNTLKEVLSVIYKPLAIIAAGFAAFKIGAVLVNGLTQAMTMLKGVMTALAAHPLLLALTALVGVIIWVSDAFKRAGGDWSKVFEIMNQDLIDFLNLFGGLGDYLNQALAPFKDFLNAIGSIISSVLGIVVNTFKLIWAYISGSSDEAKDALVDALAGSIKGVFNGLVSFISEGLSLIFKLLSSLSDALIALGSLIVDGLIKAFSYLPTALMGLLGLIGDLLKAVLKGLVSIGASIVEGIASLISSFFGNITSFISSLFANVYAAFKENLSLLASWFKDGFAAIGAGAKALFAPLISFISSIASTIAQAFNFIGSKLNELTNFISSIFTSLFGAISQSINSALNAIGQLFAALNQKISAIVEVIKGAFVAMGQVFLGLYQKISNIASNISEAFIGAFNKLKSLASNLIDGLKNSFVALASFIGSLWSFDTLKQAISNLGKLFSGVLSSFDSLGASIKALFAQITGYASELYKSISSVFNGLIDTISGAFDSALNAAVTFFDSLFSFIAQIPQKIAQAFDVSALIDSATNKLKSLTSNAFDGVKSMLGFSKDKDEQKQQEKAVMQAINNTINTVNNSALMHSQIAANVPAMAQTTSITNSTYNNDNSKKSQRTQQINNTVNINVPNNTDARSIVREAQKSFNNFNTSNNYVMASEYGNFNT